MINLRGISFSFILLVQFFVGANTINGTSSDCQIRRPLRKQVEAEPLAGMCLKDIVVRFSKTLRSIGTEELGLTAFQEMLDRLDLAKTQYSLDEALENLVSKINSKLSSYDKLLEQCDNAIQSILLNEHYYSGYADETMDSSHSPKESADLCSQIENGNGRRHPHRYIYTELQ